MTPEALLEAHDTLKMYKELKEAARSIKDSEQITLTDEDGLEIAVLNGEAKTVVYNAILQAAADLNTKLCTVYGIEMRYAK